VVFTEASELLGAHERHHEVDQQPDSGNQGEHPEYVHSFSSPQDTASTTAAKMAITPSAVSSVMFGPPRRARIYRLSVMKATVYR
jgi:hypothetical protein